jgi:hypothetical protein
MTISIGVATNLPPQLDHKQLKALAKASRPWYLKKRFWALGVVGVIIVAMAASSGGSKGSTDTKTNGGVSTLSNNGSNPPQADVEITSCSTGVIGPEAALRITNHSSGRSNYMISVNFLDASGTKVAEGTAISNNIEPGQAAVEQAAGFTQTKGAVTCKVIDVNRFASN